MSQVTDCARALAEAIVASEEYTSMQINEKAAMSDPAVTEAMGRYLELKQTLDGVMHQEEPDPDAIARIGREMDEVQQALNAMPAVEAMTASRPAFSGLMNQVNQILEFIITGDVGQQGGCSGNCASCGGCH